MALRCEFRSAKTSKSSNEELIAWIDRLPQEVQPHVLTKLPISSLFQCKLVSRLWNALLKEPFNITMHLKHAVANNDPCLIICPEHKLPMIADIDSASNGNPEIAELQMIADIDSARNGNPEIAELQMIADIDSARNVNPEIAKVLIMPILSARFMVLGSSHGLVCLIGEDKMDGLRICNPFTIEYRALPTLYVQAQRNVRRVVFGFGYDPVTMKYKFVEIIHYERNNNNSVGADVEAFIITLGNPGWKDIGNIPYRLFSLTSEAEVDGKLHWRWLTKTQRQIRSTGILSGQIRSIGILSLDLTTEEFCVVPRPSCGSLDNADYHLVTLQGCLSAVVSWDDRHEVWTMKDYNMQASWIKHFAIERDLCVSFMRDIASEIPQMKDRRARIFEVLCSLKNGEILILYLNNCLVCYNPETGELRNLDIQKLPTAFLAHAHVGSLISLDTVFGIHGGE